MLSIKALKNQGNIATLFAAFLYFDFSFMVWTILGPLIIEISESLMKHEEMLTDQQQATLLAIPILSGALLRIVLGFSVDKVGPKLTALIAQLIVIVVLFYTYLRAESITYNELLIVALGLGFAGASFAVALPQAGQWYPPKLQGVVLGIAGAGNIGVVIDFIFAPKIAEKWGWEVVFLVGGVLSLLVFIFYLIMAKDAPKSIYSTKPKKLLEYWKLLKNKDAWWLMFFYAVSFGGFVGLANYMKVYLINTYEADMLLFGQILLNESNVKVIAGYFGALTIFAGAILRPIGGALADKIGGIRALYIFFGIVAILVFFMASLQVPFVIAIVILFSIMANLGMANGAVFQLVPQRFGKDIGIMTGLIGAAGGLGGAFLVKIFGWTKSIFESYSMAFVIFASIVLMAILVISLVKTKWRKEWSLRCTAVI